ncbi:MAG: HlyD family type I secretion periplasmic adaptor subunit [Desulfuromusa sp.]|nr:HlyD family type I secretion periplasmic adaptor subunit [Desulfuromusa sp.]
MNEKKTPSLFQRLLQKNRITKEDYQQIEDENTPPPKLNVSFADSRKIIFSGLFVVGLFFGIGGLWITFAEITGAVIASGEVRVDTERKTVQHLEGGIVRQILVRNGDQVEVGQTLLLLDSSQIVAATDQILLQLAAARIEKVRLIAERELLKQPDWQETDATIPADNYSGLLASARKVFSAGRLALENQTALLGKQINQLYQQIGSIDDRLVAEHQVSATLQEELDAKLVLFEDNYIDKTRILELRRALADRQGTQAQLRGSQAELRERVAEFELRISTVESEYRQQAITRLSEIQQTFFALEQKLLPLQDARNRLRVTAPVSGEVVALQVHSEGGVIQPGQPILDIVPKESPLIVECHIMVADITHIQQGQLADVQLLAFSSRTTPKIVGKVIYISADRILQKTAYGDQPSYVVHVELDKQELNDNDLYLTAGMPAAVFIRTKPRTVLDYALEPLKDNFDRALREN